MFNLFKNKKVYLDHGAATPVLKHILMLKSDDLYHNPSAIYNRAVDVKRLLNQCRQEAGKMIKARASEIIWTSSGTESVNLAIRGFVYSRYYEIYNRDLLSNSDSLAKVSDLKKINVITSNIEHSAVLDTLYDLEKMGFVSLYVLPVEHNGVLESNVLRDKIEDLKRQNIDVDLVSIMYVNNEIGTIQNIKEYGRAIDEYNRKYYNNYFDNPYESEKHNHKIVFMTDACQAANYLDIDVRKLKVDMMIVNASKIYGGKGSALLYKNKNININPIITGGGQERGMRSGTENINSIYTFTKALSFVNKKEERQKEVDRLRFLQIETHKLLKNNIPDIKFWPDLKSIEEPHLSEYLEKKSPNNINFSLSGINSDEMIIRLDKYGFEVSHKSACDAIETSGSYVLQRIGATTKESTENIRVTMGRDTTLKDMKEFVKALKEIYYKYKK